jgi:hypothetical protein
METIAERLYSNEPEILKCFGADNKYKYFLYFFNPNNGWRYPAFTKKIDRAKLFTNPQEKYDVVQYFRAQNELNYIFTKPQD